jgi:hypothetical protein
VIEQCCNFHDIDKHYIKWGDIEIGDNCIVFENFSASIEDLMVAN